MTIILVMLLIGAFGGFISGLVGIGGAIIIYPVLLFVPPLLGLPEYSPYVASGLTAVQVFFSTLSGSIKAVTRPDFSLSLVLHMGGGMIVGSIIGAISANVLNENVVSIVYIVIALLALCLMFIKPNHNRYHKSYNTLLLMILGGIIGLISGILGAGGAFIIIPVLLVIFKLPMKQVVTNSIVIAFISSLGAFVVKLIQGFIPFEEALGLIIGSIIFAQVGMKIGRKTPSRIQSLIIIVFIIIAIAQIVMNL